MDLRPPNINATTTEGQIKQLKDYIFMLVTELNIKFTMLDKERGEK